MFQVAVQTALRTFKLAKKASVELAGLSTVPTLFIIFKCLIVSVMNADSFFIIGHCKKGCLLITCIQNSLIHPLFDGFYTVSEIV